MMGFPYAGSSLVSQRVQLLDIRLFADPAFHEIVLQPLGGGDLSVPLVRGDGPPLLARFQLIVNAGVFLSGIIASTRKTKARQPFTRASTVLQVNHGMLRGRAPSVIVKGRTIWVAFCFLLNFGKNTEVLYADSR